MTKESVPPCFELGGVSYRFVSIEGERVKTLLLSGGLGFIFLPLKDVLEHAKEIPEPNE